MNIKLYKHEVKKALEEINKFQLGEELIVKTERPYLDNEFPVINGSVITVAASSGVGKSYELQRLINTIMDVNVNPASVDYAFLNVSLEMKVRSLVLRALHSRMKKRKRDILQEEFTEEEQLLVNEFLKSVDDDRQFISQDPETATSFLTGCKEFLEANKEKKSVFIAIDHLALIGSDRGQNKNQVIEAVIEGVNDLKMLYPNSIWIFVSQLNSDIKKRVADKSRYAQPTDSDLYYSGFTFQISDYVVVIVNPYSMGIKEYTLVDPDRYPNLEGYFLTPDKKGMCSLETYGVNYYHLLKLREREGWYIDIFAEDLPIPNLEEQRKRLREEIKPEVASAPPVFDTTSIPVFNTAVLQNNQGAGFDVPPF